MEILAFGAILACLIGKFVLALKTKSSERKLKQEKTLLEAAKMEMNRRQTETSPSGEKTA